MNVLYFGNGWYNLENSETGNFIWSSNNFSIYVDSSVKELKLYIGCTKVYNEYKLKYSLDGWESFVECRLDSGFNNIKILLNSNNRIDFKCDWFIPSKIENESLDERKLGIRLHNVVYTTEYEQEIELKNIPNKLELYEKINPLNENQLTLGDGWYDIENNFRWSNGEGIINIHSNNVELIKINIYSPYKQVLTINSDVNTLTIEVDEGYQDVFIKNNQNDKWIKLISKPYIPSDFNTSFDNRNLGIRIYDIDISDKDHKVKTFNVKNIFLEKDYIKLNNFLKSNSDKVSEIYLGGHILLNNFKHNNDGKFKLNNQIVFYTHRSGWNYAIQSIKQLHSDFGVDFNGFLEKTFHWDKYNNIKNNIIPLKDSWIGVIHNPMMNDYDDSEIFSSKKLLNSIMFQKSLKSCKGLYVLSNDLKNKLQKIIKDVKIDFLYHPTEKTNILFTLDNFYKNDNKKLINIGSWARKFITIFLVTPPPCIRKLLIEPPVINNEKFKDILNLEKEKLCIESEISLNSIETIKYQTSKCYDNMLSENIVLMDFYDVSASNLVIECMVRNTPILVRKHNAIIDYLGEDYPFYFNSVEEASDKINDLELIEKTYNYLVTLKTKDFLSGEYFCESIKNGEIYKSL